jgi:hypothetical protein
VPVWLLLAGWLVVLLVIGRRSGALRGADAATRVVSALALAGAGVVVAVVGLLLEIELCLGSGSECDDVEPLWSPGGAVVMYAGLAIAFFAPVVPLLRRGPSTPTGGAAATPSSGDRP